MTTKFTRALVDMANKLGACPELVDLVKRLPEDEAAQFYSAIPREIAVELVRANLDEEVTNGTLGKDSTGRYWCVDNLKPKGST